MALADLKPGQVISVRNPLVYTVADREKGKRCDGCFTDTPLENEFRCCKYCKRMWYCSSECQLKDWMDAHRHNECKLYALVGDVGWVERERLMLRLLAREVYCKPLPFQYLKLFKKLCTKTGVTPGAYVHPSINVEICKVSVKIDIVAKQSSTPLNAEVTPGDIAVCMPLFSKILTNSYNIFNAHQQVIGVAFYAGPAMSTKQNCVPNVAAVFNGLKMTLRAVQDIEEGETLLVNFCDLKRKFVDRRTELRACQIISCKGCARCDLEAKNRVWHSVTEQRLVDVANANELLRFVTAYDLPEKDTILRAYELGIAALKVYKQIFSHHYHPDYTYFLYKLTQVRFMLTDEDELKLNMPPEKSLAKFKCEFVIYNELHNHITMTHGKKHDLFKLLLKLESVETKKFKQRLRDYDRQIALARTAKIAAAVGVASTAATADDDLGKTIYTRSI